MKLALVLALAGCDNVLGLTRVTGFDAPPPDVPMQQVSGDYFVLSMRNDTTFAPQMVATPVSASDVSLSASLPDGTQLPVALGGDGTIAFQTPIGAAYELDVQRSVDAVPSILRTSAQSFHFRSIDPDRQGAVIARQQTLLEWTMTQTPVTSAAPYAQIAATGIRGQFTPESGDLDHPMIDWAHTGRGLPDAGEHDELYYERWQNKTATYYQITDYLRISVTLRDGAGASIAGPTNALAAGSCVHLLSNRPADSMLLHQHSLATTLSDGWGIESIPVPALGVAGALPLVDGTVAGVSDNLDVVYGTPFSADAGFAATTAVSGSRLLKLPTSNIPFTAADSLIWWALFTPTSGTSCPTNAVRPDSTPVALVDTAMLGGTALATDGQQVTIDRSAPVAFDYTLTSDSYDDVIITLFEVVNVGIPPTTQTSVIALRQYFSTSSIPIDPTLLAKNHYYVVTVATRVGFPNARQLDYSTVAFPAATSRIWTAMFQIAN